MEADDIPWFTPCVKANFKSGSDLEGNHCFTNSENIACEQFRILNKKITRNTHCNWEIPSAIQIEYANDSIEHIQHMPFCLGINNRINAAYALYPLQSFTLCEEKQHWIFLQETKKYFLMASSTCPNYSRPWKCWFVSTPWYHKCFWAFLQTLYTLVYLHVAQARMPSCICECITRDFKLFEAHLSPITHLLCHLLNSCNQNFARRKKISQRQKFRAIIKGKIMLTRPIDPRCGRAEGTPFPLHPCCMTGNTNTYRRQPKALSFYLQLAATQLHLRPPNQARFSDAPVVMWGTEKKKKKNLQRSTTGCVSYNEGKLVKGTAVEVNYPQRPNMRNHRCAYVSL